MDALKVAKEIMRIIKNAGFECLIVGGYVRDSVLGNIGSDIDLATNALPEDVMKLFKRVVPTGLKHGTVTIVKDKFQFEVTTFRSETNYLDNRHPETVQFESSFAKDVLRRDFTMNALGLTIDDEIIDYVDGINDIKEKKIRAVGSASKRFSEDALRMLRAFRFQSQLGFELDDEIKVAIVEKGNLIKSISLERVLSEFEKLVLSPYVLISIDNMIETHFLDHLPIFKNGFAMIKETQFKPYTIEEFYAAIALNASLESIDELPMSNYLKKSVHLVYEMIQIGITEFNEILLFRNGLETCLSVNHINQVLKKSTISDQEIINKYEALPIKKQCDLVFKGDQIIELFDRKPGAWISDILDDICLQVIMRKVKNDYNEIRQYLLKKY